MGVLMAYDRLHLRSRSKKQAFYPVIVAFAASCFVGVLATDIAYWGTADMMWADFSAWLVTAGVIVGYLAVLVTLIEVLAVRSARRRPPWPYVIGNIVALILATFNMMVHTRDAWTSVVPWGLVLSAAVVLALFATGWLTRETHDAVSAEMTS